MVVVYLRVSESVPSASTVSRVSAVNRVGGFGKRLLSERRTFPGQIRRDVIERLVTSDGRFRPRTNVWIALADAAGGTTEQSTAGNVRRRLH